MFILETKYIETVIRLANDSLDNGYDNLENDPRLDRPTLIRMGRTSSLLEKIEKSIIGGECSLTLAIELTLEETITLGEIVEGEIGEEEIGTDTPEPIASLYKELEIELADFN